MKKRKKNLYGLLIVLLLFLGTGYAALTTDLSINGVTNVAQSSWDIHFENLSVKTGSVTPDSAANIDTPTSISYEITLNQPGDFYEFTVDAKNDGTIDAMIESLTSKYNGVAISSSNPLPNYIEYSVSYSDGEAIEVNQLLRSSQSEKYKVKVAFKKDINPEDLPSSDVTLLFNFIVTYVQADDNAVDKPIPTFADDDWNTIISKIGANHSCGPYSVGDTREIDMGSLGTHTIRISNCSTPAECSTAGFSQTACGVVLEFVDVITTHTIIPAGVSFAEQNSNVGGWPASVMRVYLNDLNDPTSIINLLPEEIKNSIIDTTVVAGHGNNVGETNFTSTDKLYLLSMHEVWEDNGGITGYPLDGYDSAYHNTRQLDYYEGLNITNTNYSGAIKKNGSVNATWWLRTATINRNDGYWRVIDTGMWNGIASSNSLNGVSPAFRIG